MCKKGDKTTKITREMKKLYIKIKNSVTQPITKKKTISNKKKLKENRFVCIFILTNFSCPYIYFTKYFGIKSV